MPETHVFVSHFHDFATNSYETSNVCYIRQDKLIYEEGFIFPKNCLTFVTLVSFNKKNANTQEVTRNIVKLTDTLLN